MAIRKPTDRNGPKAIVSVGFNLFEIRRRALRAPAKIIAIAVPRNMASQPSINPAPMHMRMSPLPKLPRYTRDMINMGTLTQTEPRMQSMGVAGSILPEDKLSDEVKKEAQKTASPQRNRASNNRS